MQSRTTVKSNLTVGRMVIIKKMRDNQGRRGCREMGASVHCQWAYEL